MDTIKIEGNKTKMIAHRGVSGIECENTIAAFIAAGNRSYFGIETDVHVTSDNNFIIIHDGVTKRLTDSDLIVEKTSFSKLRKLKVYDREVGKYRSDLYLPSLEEYIGICSRYQKKAVLELKNPMEEKNIRGIISEIEKQNYIDDTIIISFSFENITTVQKLMPSMNVEFLCCEVNDELINRLIAKRINLDLLHTAVTKELTKTLHDNGLELNCWVVDGKEDAQRYISYGVDYITSNILE